jgi:hypothetical protein
VAPSTKPARMPALPPEALRLAFCVAGVMGSLLVYGVLQVRSVLEARGAAARRRAPRLIPLPPLPVAPRTLPPFQERIMTLPFGKGDSSEVFKYSLFLVSCNRLVGAVIAAGTLLVRCPPPLGCAPLGSWRPPQARAAAASPRLRILGRCGFSANRRARFALLIVAKTQCPTCDVLPRPTPGSLPPPTAPSHSPQRRAACTASSSPSRPSTRMPACHCPTCSPPPASELQPRWGLDGAVAARV